MAFAAVLAVLLASGSSAAAHPARAHVSLADPALTTEQLNDLQAVTTWHITETTDYEDQGTGNGTFGGTFTWSGSNTDTYKTNSDIMVSGLAGCQYHSNGVGNCLPVSGSGTLDEISMSSEQVSKPLCPPTFPQSESVSEDFDVEGTGSYSAGGGYFSIDYGTNPPQAYASIFSSDIPGTDSVTASPNVDTRNPSNIVCSAGGTDTGDTSDDSFVSFSDGTPNLDEEGDTAVQVVGNQFVIHDSVSQSGTADGDVFFYDNVLPTFDFPLSATNSAEWTATADIPSADLAITKTAPQTAKPGSNLTYVITLTNNGPSAATNTTVRDPVPTGTTLVSVTQTAGSDPFTCNTATPTIICFLRSGTLMASSASDTFNVVVTVGTGVKSGITISNTATASNNVTDPDMSNNSATANTLIAKTGADVSVKKTGPATVIAGHAATYTITVAGKGNANALGVELTDALPAGITFTSLTQSSGPAFDCTTPAAGTNGTVTCDADSLATGASAVFKLAVKILPGDPAGTLENTANVTTTTLDPSSANNTSTASTTITTSADVGVTKSAAATVVAGRDFTYTITATDHGPSDAQGVLVSDALPAGTTFASEAQTAGPTLGCTTPAVGASGTVTCSVATLPEGQSATVQVKVLVASSAADGSKITNTASAATATADPSSANNTASVTTTVQVLADLGIVKSVPATFTPGTTVHYTITVEDHGPSNAAGVAWSDVLAGGFESLAQSSGPSFSCSTPTIGGGGTISCTASTLAAGSPAVFKLVVDAPDVTDGTTVSNTATVTGTSTDSNSANDSATATSTAASKADVFVTKTAPATVAAGAAMTYTIHVGNHGPNAASNFALADILPANTTFLSLTQTLGPTLSCSTPAVGAAGTVSCSLASLDAAGSATLRLKVMVAAAAGSGVTISNTATVSTSTADSNSADDSATVSTTTS